MHYAGHNGVLVGAGVCWEESATGRFWAQQMRIRASVKVESRVSSCLWGK